MPSVDELFPEQPKSVDDLFPPEMEKDRYRRQTLGTSPIQDLLFGDTRVNPVARVLDHFRQGAAQAWGATDATRLSKESEDFLKTNKQFDAWNEGQGSLMKAANESLFRPAAVQMVKEMHDAEALYRGVGALFHGTQEAVSQIGSELTGGAIDTGLKKVSLGGTEQLGHDVAGAFEALPTGLRQPTGIPHAAPHPMLAEIERARDLGIIGAGEEGYQGTRPAEVAPPISAMQEAVKPAVEAVPEAPKTPEPGLPEAAPVPNPIVEDVAQKLIAAGRPEAEARASGELIASHYEARAERFGGQRGTAEEMYAADAPDIRPGEGAGPVKSEPIKPNDNAGAAEPPKEMEFNQAERELDQIKRGKISLRGDMRPIITLFKDANASTFIHETGHAWLEELMKDADHPKSPGSLRDDAATVQEWLGVHSAEDIKTSHHEKFARGFERYMMEGKAPNQALANVFEKFKNWLTKIYQTVTRLKSPINDEIRGVFDRLLTMHPSEVRIEPEGPPKSFADIHEADALGTSPEAAHPVAETIQAERDRVATEHVPEEHDARLEGVTSEAGRREAGGPQPLRDVNEARPDAAEARDNQASGAVGEGGSVAPSESARPSVGGGKTEAPVSPQERFGPESALVDKAGNIRIDNLGTGEDVSKAIRDAAEQNNGFIEARRGVITDGQVLELADALGMDESKLSARKLGQAFNAEQIMAARKLLIQSATNVRDAMVKAAQGAEADIMAYAEAKARHQMIQEQVAGLTAEAGRALRAFRKLEGQQEAGQIDAFLKEATGKTLFQLQREAQLGSQLATPADVSKFINDSSKPTWKDMVIEAWISALLSGPKTHVANIMGNTISGLARPVETAISAGIGKVRNLVTGTQDRVLLGEAKAELFGMVQGAREGVVAAVKAFKTEEPQLTPVNQTERGHQKAIPSATVSVFGHEMEIGGKQARIPLRLLGAEDEVFKAITFRGDINRQAYAIAAKENLPPEQFNARVAELSRSPTDEMVNKAKDAAEYQTFQTPLGKVGRSVQNFANSHILAKFVLPFVRTPINLLKYAGERTPLGLFSEGVRDNLSGKNGAVARDTQMSRIALGTMVGIATYELASQGLITGGGPADKNKKAVMQANGWQDYSIRIGDMYYRYNRLDPFSVILGVVADAHEIYNASGSEHPDKEKIPSMVFAAVTQNILNRASLQGVSDLIQAVTDHERYGRNYIKKMAGTVVPALSSQTAQALDPVVREARTALDGIKARIPGLSQTLLPKRDVWGEPITREGGLGPDIASPIIEARMKNDPVNKALLDAGYYPGHLSRKIRGIELTDEQYDDYQRVAGRTAKVRLNAAVNMISNPNIPASVRHDAIKSIIDVSRETAQSLVIMQSVNGENNIMKKAADAKRLKLQGETTH